MNSAITQANTGRSIKNFAMSGLPYFFAGAPAEAGG